MILCMCRGVTDREVEQAIAGGAESVADVARRCGAGGDCGTCVEDIGERLAGAARTVHVAA